LIDLHTHTTASDGRCTPAELVARASGAGVTVLSVTDHDTVAGCAAVSAACRASNIDFVPGIEITAVREGGDIHVLGYFLDVESVALARFLAEQRQRRVDRVRQMIARLARLGISLDADAILAPGLIDSSKAVGRPWIAAALVAGGHVASRNEAFDRYLARGRPAFVPRTGAPPAEVIARIHDAHGLAAIAHPGLIKRDEWLGDFASAGADAFEVFHPDHDEEATARYLAFAKQFGLAVSGGSDYHGDDSHGAPAPGAASLPREHYDRLRATRRATASGADVSS
jgi:predicted metal-dependent phosphoesterase TrpH